MIGHLPRISALIQQVLCRGEVGGRKSEVGSRRSEIRSRSVSGSVGRWVSGSVGQWVSGSVGRTTHARRMRHRGRARSLSSVARSAEKDRTEPVYEEDESSGLHPRASPSASRITRIRLSFPGAKSVLRCLLHVPSPERFDHGRWAMHLPKTLQPPLRELRGVKHLLSGASGIPK